MRYEVRFHLGKGKNYAKWQVKSAAGVQYYDPSEVSLTLLDCQLRNQPAAARKIYEGANKNVCAWIDCNEVFVSGVVDAAVLQKLGGIPVRYNPKVAPYWRNFAGEKIDGVRAEVLRTRGRTVLATGERVITVRGLVRLAPSAAEEHALGPMKQEK